MNYDMQLAPRSNDEVVQLLAARPRGWEYMLYAGILVIGIGELEAQYDDYTLGYAPRSGVMVGEDEFIYYIRSQLNELTEIVPFMEKLFSDEIMGAALGPPGVAGDPDKIIHAAKRVVRLYEDLLEWARRIRSMAMPDQYHQVAQRLVRFSEQPVNELRDFAFRHAARVDGLPAAIASGKKVKLIETVTFSIGEDRLNEFNRSLDLLRKM